MTAAGNFNRQQWMPRKGEHPMLRLPGMTQNVEQQKYDRQIAKYKRNFERERGFVNRCHEAKKELCARRIRTGQVGIVQAASLGSVEAGERWITGNNQIRVVAEPLEASIPDIAMNIVIRACGHHKKCTVPHGR